MKEALARFDAMLDPDQRKLVRSLKTPMQIQAFLDDTPYSIEPRYRCPLSVVRDRRAHCFDGASFAAMALARLGHPPLLVDMLPWDDDDHVLAVFRAGRWFGAIAKSNFVGLRYREPVYRDLRELLMSYFEPFFNLAKARTLRGYTRPVRLTRFAKAGWLWRDDALDTIADALDAAPRVTLFDKAQIKAFTRVDELTFKAHLCVADPQGMYQPKQG